MAKKVNVGELLTTFILIIIALALTPTVADSVASATGGNVTGTAATILDLVPMFWVLIILSIGAAKVYSQFKELE